ncbi:uncharacterized protein LOC128386000 [Panonychus citri]|uniref:uncharacterized protein LOC128386000 n=1 Tax=Panonychus citri TaxID=50023 RepID=UPI00230834C9|nr:uncharacterized protein LOC128386000 [Panonychus citri]
MDANRFTVINCWLIQREILNKPIIHWVLIIDILFCGLYLEIHQMGHYFRFPFPSSRFEMILFFSFIIGLIRTFLQILLIFRLDWSQFWSYVRYIDLINIPEEISREKKLQRKRSNRVLIQFTLTLAFHLLGASSYMILKKFNIGMFLLFTFLIFGHCCLLVILNDSTACLSFTFQTINSSIERFNFIDDERIQLDRLKTYQKNYFYAVQSTLSAECFFKDLVTFHYSRNSLDIIMLFFSIAFRVEDSVHLIIHVIWSFIILINILAITFLTTNLNSVHVNSEGALEDLYELSFETDSVPMIDQIKSFLNRITKANVGFTFADLVLISPNFITSLLTLSFTILLGLINFVNH